MEFLIDDLLNFSKLDTGSFTLNVVEFEVIGLIEEIRHAFEPLLQPTEQALKIAHSAN